MFGLNVRIKSDIWHEWKWVLLEDIEQLIAFCIKQARVLDQIRSGSLWKINRIEWKAYSQSQEVLASDDVVEDEDGGMIIDNKNTANEMTGSNVSESDISSELCLPGMI